jgi:hypothetical protein
MEAASLYAGERNRSCLQKHFMENGTMPVEISPIVFDILAGATALGALIQAGVLLGMLIAFRRLQNKVEQILDPMMEHALPLIASSRLTLDELSPKLKIITNNLVEVSDTLKHESHNIKGSVDDVLEKTRAQTARVDEMVSGTLDGITHASAVIQHGIEVPLRQLSGIFNGLRAGFGTLREKKPVSPAASAKRAEEEFVLAVEEVTTTHQAL